MVIVVQLFWFPIQTALIILHFKHSVELGPGCSHTYWGTHENIHKLKKKNLQMKPKKLVSFKEEWLIPAESVMEGFLQEEELKMGLKQLYSYRKLKWS